MGVPGEAGGSPALDKSLGTKARGMREASPSWGGGICLDRREMERGERKLHFKAFHPL